MATKFAESFAAKGVTIAQATGIAQAKLDGFKIVHVIYDGQNEVYDAVWTSGTITLSDYNAFPIGSVIRDCIGFTYNLHTDATTWKSETLS